MPLFHVHTFLALSIVLGFWLLIGTWETRKQIALLLAAAFVPATWIVWMITDHFQAKSILAWAPGWVQSDPGFAVPALHFGFVKIPSALGFWIYNFGLTLPAMIALVGVVVWRTWKNSELAQSSRPEASDANVGGALMPRSERGSIHVFQRLRFRDAGGGDLSLRALRQDGTVGLGQHQVHHLGLFHLSALLVARIDCEMAVAGARGRLLSSLCLGIR